jgi:hypothetical protein
VTELPRKPARRRAIGGGEVDADVDVDVEPEVDARGSIDGIEIGEIEVDGAGGRPLSVADDQLVEVEELAEPTPLGVEQLRRARLDVLDELEAGSLQPFERFQRVVELELERARRYGYALSVALFAIDLPPPAPPPGVPGILRARAGNALVDALRDVDVATVLPLDLSRAYASVPVSDERFLVLLPYTELGGAALLARRVMGAVAELAPVVAAGRTFAPRFVGAVAGAAPGEPVSFSRLLKEATRALEQARRDGAELAVPLPLAPGGA